MNQFYEQQRQVKDEMRQELCISRLKGESVSLCVEIVRGNPDRRCLFGGRQKLIDVRDMGISTDEEVTLHSPKGFQRVGPQEIADSFVRSKDRDEMENQLDDQDTQQDGEFPFFSPERKITHPNLKEARPQSSLSIGPTNRYENELNW